jgi:hypothetical protein
MSRSFPLVVAGLLGQALVVGQLAGADGRGAGALVAVHALAAALAIAAERRVSPRSRHALRMFAVGGFGMAFGWWADLGFSSAVEWIAHPLAPAGAWCGLAPVDGARGTLPHLHVFSWMNLGMLAAGAVAARALEPPCRGARLALESLGMMVGMHGGGWLVARAELPGQLAVVLAHTGMNLGMLAGMSLARIADALDVPGRATCQRSS